MPESWLQQMCTHSMHRIQFQGIEKTLEQASWSRDALIEELVSNGILQTCATRTMEVRISTASP